MTTTPTITIGLDLGDRVSRYCVLGATATVQGAGSVPTTRAALTALFTPLPHGRVVLEVGTHSPWVSRLVAGLGHDVIVANACRVRLISAAVRKSDALDAETLARLGRADPPSWRRSAIAANPPNSHSPRSGPAMPWCEHAPC